MNDNEKSNNDALVHLLCASRLHHINTFWGMSLGNCLEWKIKHFSYCCRLYYTNIRMMLDIYSYTMWYMRQYLGIVQIFLFFCIPQSNSTLTSSYLCTPSILLYQVQRECARTLTIVAALLYIIRLVDEYLINSVCIHELDIKHIKERFKKQMHRTMISI